MKNIFKNILKIAILAGLLVSVAGPVLADTTPNFWYKSSTTDIATNTGNGLANANIHVAGCYIGMGFGTPCGGGGGGTITGSGSTPYVTLWTGTTSIGISSHLSFQESIGEGQLKVGNALLWINQDGFNPSSLWLGESAGHDAAISTSGRNTGVGYFVGSSMTTGSNDSFFGQAAGYANTTGNNNSFFGSSAGRFNTTGGANTFIGEEAGYANVIGSSNTFNGYSAGLQSTGDYNAFYGAFTGQSTDTGTQNSFFGTLAGANTTSGSDNVFFGFRAGQNWQTKSGQVAIGSQALYGNIAVVNNTGEKNSAVGFQALQSTSGGSSNAAFGYQAGLVNTTGSGNVFVGDSAGISNINGFVNVFIGAGAGRYQDGHNNQIAIGGQALEGSNVVANNTGNANLAIGTSAGASNTTGSFNNFIGNNSGTLNTAGASNTFVGFDSGSVNTTGSRNTFLGTGSGSATDADDNVFIGYHSGIDNAIGTNNIAIGSNTMVGALSSFSSIFIGSGATEAVGGVSNSIGIGQDVAITDSNQLLFGSAAHPIYEAKIGDYTSSGRSNYLFIDDFNQAITLESGYNSNPGTVFSSTWEDNGSIGETSIGDLSGNANNLFFKVDDANKTIIADSADGDFFAGDYNNIGGSTLIALQDSISKITMQGTNLVLGFTQTQFNGNLRQPSIVQISYGATADYSANATFGGRSMIMVSGSTGATTILLPTGTVASIGTIITIKDHDLIASTSNITVDAGTGSTIKGSSSAQTFVMNTNGKGITLIKGTSNSWDIISSTN